MSDPIIIKILLSVCGTLAGIGLKVLMGISKNVADIDRKLPAMAENIKHLEKEMDRHTVQIEKLQKTA